MKSILSLLLLVVLVSAAWARPIGLWSYSQLEKAADLVAITEVSDIQPSDARLPNVPHPKWFQAWLATLKPLWVIKGDKSASEIKLLFFRYSKQANPKPNGAIFASLEKGNGKHYLVFLKKGKAPNEYSPVSGDYDAGQSIHAVTQSR